MRSINRNRPLPQLSFWDQLDTDIDKITHRAKDKLQTFQLKQVQTTRHNPQTKPILKVNLKKVHSKSSKQVTLSKTLSNLDRRQLEKLEKAESDKQALMKNRLTYLKQDKEKQNKTIQLAKKKFQQIVHVRAQSFQQKEAIKSKLRSIDAEDRHMKSTMVNQVKTSKQRRNLSLENWKFLVFENAKDIRNQTINNQSMTAQEKQRLRQQNARRARQTKKSLERSRSIVSQVKQKRITQTKSYKKQQLSTRLQALTQQKKTNEAIYMKLKLETQKITKWKSRAQRQIQQYRSYLEPAKNSSMMRTTSKQSESQKSFYITNF